MPTPVLAGLRAAGTLADDPTGALVDLLVVLTVIAGVGVVLHVARVLWWRERTLRRLVRDFPEQADDLRRAFRSAPLFGPSTPAPADPYARTHDVTVAPLGDGRPGWSLRAPGPAAGGGDIGPDGSRQDARVVLADGVHLLVVCLGRVGSRWREHEVLPAPARAERFATQPPDGWRALGPVDRVDSPLGAGWRVTASAGGPSVLTDTHVDRDGWAFVVGVLSSSWHARAVEAADRILATWVWHDDAPAPPARTTPA
ncbi:hypothetical protein OMK64_02315 [Cellulomonas fimi]|uniref:hypothetical protein n=1 Tax=Cellulomonas fimi TaxID=1708 RepID=UPI00234E0DF7|nr:hypothetical protein [Cellulomonas fimi]MDC7120364.1 hypothetical protein [Cellulomonas fimi]